METKKNIRIAIIGAGHIAQVAHIPTWKKLNDVEIVAICDKVQTKAQWVAKRCQIPSYYSDAAEIFKRKDIDAVDICTETNTHKSLVIEALESGKHVLVEKPMATNYEDALAMVNAAEKCKKNLMVAMNVRFRRDAITLKSFIDGNELGDVFYARAGWMTKRNFPETEKNWLYQKEKAGGGVLMDLGIQMLDVLWWLQGNLNPASVKANIFNTNSSIEVEDTAVCSLNFDNGSVLSLEVSWSILAEKNFLYANLFGANGTATINPLRVYKDMHGNRINIIPTRDESSTVRYKRSYRNEMKHFISCLKRGVPLQASGREIAERLKVIDAFYRSAREGKEVFLG